MSHFYPIATNQWMDSYRKLLPLTVNDDDVAGTLKYVPVVALTWIVRTCQNSRDAVVKDVSSTSMPPELVSVVFTYTR